VAPLKPGIESVSLSASRISFFSSVTGEKVSNVIGTVCAFSSRRRAVTTISSRPVPPAFVAG
jgi:hypothetical protein